MGFTRYGTTFERDIIPEKTTSLANYLPSFIEKPFVIKEMGRFSGKEAETQTSVAYFIKELLRFFEIDMHLTREEYVDKYEIGLSHLAAFLKSENKIEGYELNDISRIKLMAALASSTLMTRLVRSELKKAKYDIPESAVEKMGKSLWALIVDITKADSKYHMMHLLTLKDSGKAIFQYHLAELIYAYLTDNNIHEENK